MNEDYHHNFTGTTKIFTDDEEQNLPLSWQGYYHLHLRPYLRFKKIKEKIPKNISRCAKFNGVKNFQIFAHLVFFTCIRSSTKK
ncbi:hypothetical protein KFY46_26445, partial [Salmonella enterica subsp. enterica serovar 1,4,[5],12:i:-]|nr:hypothetical protein [Salmonella enterica subsp. enterica serovar 1,4,[5],12:i:-]